MDTNQPPDAQATMRVEPAKLTHEITFLSQMTSILAIRRYDDETGFGFRLHRTDDGSDIEVAAIRDGEEDPGMQARSFAKLFSCAPVLMSLVCSGLQRWAGPVERDEEISGCDATDWVTEFTTAAREVLRDAMSAPEGTTIVLAGATTPTPEPVHATRTGGVRVFFTRSPCMTIDVISTKDLSDNPRGFNGKQNLEEIRVKYPTAEIGEMAAMASMRDESFRHPPRQITKSALSPARDEAPPRDWVTATNGETFKHEELVCGSIANIFIRIEDRFWTMSDHCTLGHDDIIRMTVDADDRAVPGGYARGSLVAGQGPAGASCRSHDDGQRHDNEHGEEPYPRRAEPGVVSWAFLLEACDTSPC